MLLAIDGRYSQAEKFTYAYAGLRAPHAGELHLNPLGFCKGKKIGCFSNTEV